MYSDSINLLSPSTVPKNKKDVFLNWILLWGRILSLITAAFLIGVFVYRLYLDTKRNKLEEDVDSYIITLNHMKEKEIEVLTLQKILAEVSYLKAGQGLITDRLFIITEYLSDVELEIVAMTQERADFEFIVDSYEELYEIESKMREDSRIQSPGPSFSVDETIKTDSEIRVVGVVKFE
ncbi:hypothetical protein JW962_03545 [Candidatus Dojkabacteria bacterium]|nr:hypothetical protein [Candidatus Dojkabacteria bacterium]